MLDREYVRQHRTLGYVVGRMEFEGEPHVVVQPQEGAITLLHASRVMPIDIDYVQRDAQLQMESLIHGLRSFGLEDADISMAFLQALAGYRPPRPAAEPRTITQENIG